MSLPAYQQIACDCEACTVANTQAVRLPARPGKPIVVLHGRDAMKYLGLVAGLSTEDAYLKGYRSGYAAGKANRRSVTIRQKVA